MENEQMVLNTKDRNGIRIIRLCPRINIHNVFSVEEQVVALVDGSFRKIIFDFSEVEYFGSNGIRILMLARRKLDNTGGRMILCGVSPFVLKILKAIDLEDVFRITDDLASAEAELAD